MEDHPNKSDINKNVVNEKLEEAVINTASEPNHPLDRPTTLNTIPNSNMMSTVRYRRYKIDDIQLTPSPLNFRPLVFETGSIIDPATFARIEANVINKLNLIRKEEEEQQQQDDETESDDEQQLDRILIEARDEEIQRLSQIIPVNLPVNDETAQFIVEKLNFVLDNTETITNINVNDLNSQQVLTSTPSISSLSSLSSINSTHPYPPVNQIGLIKDHDRPYADYGHLDRQTIAHELQFNLQQPSTTNTTYPRLNAKSFAITSWTNVSKEIVMNKIKEEFDIKNIQYICIGEEISELNHQRHLHIQIIFKNKVDRRRPFLDEITETHCNYQVTQNDLAWNEYIKKGGDFIEFNEFISLRSRGRKEWPSSLSSSSSRALSPLPVSSSSSSMELQPLPPPPQADTDLNSPNLSNTRGITTKQPTPPPPTTTATTATTTTTTRRQTVPTTATAVTVRAQAEETRQSNRELARQAFELAKNNVHEAMDLIRLTIPDKFLAHSSWYLSTLNYINLRTRQQANQTSHPDKEYIWPDSFPDCTPQLRDAINRWIRHHFSRAKRAKCLILIGSTGLGKTSFAFSLPGQVNYFHDRWNLDQWSDYARYSVYDDIPWDNFDKSNFPNKKGLLTQNGKMNATDKYRATREINVRQPAIVLLNPEDAGSLLVQPTTLDEQRTADYWRKRASIYIMGPNEYFYKRRIHTHSDGQINQSSNSSTSANEDRVGETDEFEIMKQRYHEKHRQ